MVTRARQNAYAVRASAKLGLKHYQATISDDNIAISLNPKNNRAYYDRAQAYQALGKKAFAENDFKKAKQLGYMPPKIQSRQ